MTTQVRVMEGELKDDITGRSFTVKGGIPNMMLLEDEVGTSAIDPGPKPRAVP